MPIPVSCPNCHTGLKAPDSAAGRMVKCPKCSTPFTVPAGGEPPLGSVSAAPVQARQAAPPPQAGHDSYDNYPDDDDPGYRSGPPRRAPAGGGTGLQLGMGIASLSVGAAGLVIGMIPCIGFFPGLIAGGIGLVLGIVGLIVAITQQGRGVAFPIAGAATSVVALLVTVFWYYWIVRSVTNTIDNAGQQFKQGFENMRKEIERQKQNQPPFGNPGGEVPVPQAGGQLQLNNGVAFISANLTDADPKDKLMKDSPAKAYTVKMSAGKTYQIDLVSQPFDAFLRLENPGGQQVAFDDDSGGNLNSRIIYPCPQAGEYRIIATCLFPSLRNARTGPFTLRVQEK
jgi:hypothetical protein